MRGGGNKMYDNTLYLISLILFILHEMDAVYHKEWNMLFILKDMKENNSYVVFLLAHLPIYLLLYYSLGSELGQIIVTALLLIHAVVHYFFRKNQYNEFNYLSNILIYFSSFLSIIGLLFKYLYI